MQKQLTEVRVNFVFSFLEGYLSFVRKYNPFLHVPQHFGVHRDTEILWLGNYSLSSTDVEATRNHCDFPALLGYIACVKAEMFSP